jgi:hypothetical protein
MSIASLGIASSLASSALPQRASEADRAHRETTEQSRALDAAQSAASAGGIGETEEDSQASERDADGRRPWEQPAEAPAKSHAKLEPTKDANAGEPASKDPSGTCGNLLDLVG